MGSPGKSQEQQEAQPQSETEIHRLKALAKEHPALVLSFVYAIASMIGIVYSWAFLRHFGISVFDYAQISDFLLASLKEPFTWIIAIASVLVTAFDNSMSRRVEAKKGSRLFRWYGSPRYRSVNYLSGIVLVSFFLYFFASYKAGVTLEGEGKWVTVELAESAHIESGIQIGTTSLFLFLFEPESGKVSVHPHDSLASITFDLPKD